METSNEVVTCAYEAHRDKPETWHGDAADDWQLDTDSWTCNHTVRSELIDAEADSQFCAFHTDPDEVPEGIDEAKAFVDAINEKSSSADEADAKEKKEFVGATFGEFEIEPGTTIDSGDKHPIRLSHAVFQNGISANNVKFCQDIVACDIKSDSDEDVSFRSAEFSGEGGVSFDSAVFSGDGGVSFDFTEFSGDGRVSFDAVEFSGDGGVSFASAEFSGYRCVSFNSAKFSGDALVSFHSTEFNENDLVLFNSAEFSGDAPVLFHSTKFSSEELVSFQSTEFSGDGDILFDSAKFSGDGDAMFSSTLFSGDGRVSFDSAEFSGDGGATFCYTGFHGRVSFEDAVCSSFIEIEEASFSHPRSVSFFNANFANCNVQIDSMAKMNLERVDFSGANLSNTDFRDSRLELAVFSRAILYNTNFAGAELDGTSFGNAQVNESTTFVGVKPNSNERETIVYDPEHLQQADTLLSRVASAISRYLPKKPVWSHDPRNPPPAEPGDPYADEVEMRKINHRPEADSEVERNSPTDTECTDKTSDEEKDWEVEYLQKAAKTYHTIEKIGRENSLPNLQTVGFIRRQEMHRYRYAEQAATISEESADYWGKWLRASVARLTLLYGESPWRVIGVALSVILTAALLYPLGGFRYAGGDVVQAETFREYISILPDSLYFSTLTFTTLGFGDFQPYTWGRWLATMETALGATLIALLVFVLGRRAAR